MARRNRVTPTGEIVATDARGTFMGNRGGCLHDEGGALVRSYRSKAWLICLLEFKGRRRELMQPGLYTELFFLDEATALTAGHRPCFECRRPDAVAFARALTGLARPRAGDVDEALHPQRLPLGAGRPTWQAAAEDLPDGAMVRRNGAEWLVSDRSLRRWSFEGYGPAEPVPAGTLDVLTPEPTVRALRSGYQVTVR